MGAWYLFGPQCNEVQLFTNEPCILWPNQSHFHTRRSKPTTQNILNRSRPIEVPKPKPSPEIFYKRVEGVAFSRTAKP